MADVLQEYLVGLGFKIDEATYRRFQKTLADTAMATTKVGATLTGVASELSIGVIKIADQMENLYYAAQRAGTTVPQLQGLRYAARNIGIGADEATTAVEALRLALRVTPGKETILNQIGVQTRDLVTGKLLDFTKISNDMLHRFKAMPEFMAARYARDIGLNERQLFMWLDNLDKADAALKDHDERVKAAGLDTKALGDETIKFNNALLRLEDNLGIFGQSVQANLITPATKFVEWLDKWVEGINIVNNTMNGWLGTTLALAAALGSVIGTWRLARGALRFLGVGAAGAAAGAGAVAPSIAATAGAVGTTGAAAAGAAAATAAGIGARGWIARGLGLVTSRIGIPGAVGYAAGLGLHQYFESQGGAEKVGESVGDWANKISGHWGRDVPEQAARSTQATAASQGGPRQLPAGSSAAQGVEFFMKQGWTREQAAGIVANLQRESGLNPNAYNGAGGGQGAHGIAQWRGARWEALKKWAGTDNPNLEQQYGFIQHELETTEIAAAMKLRGSKTGSESSNAVLKYFERPGAKDLERELLPRAYLAERLTQGGGAPVRNVEINQTTTINVNGSDAADVARRVQAAQERTTAEILRNAAGAVVP